jgi:hypothetical protein
VVSAERASHDPLSVLNSGLGGFALIWLVAIASVLLLTWLRPVLRVLGCALPLLRSAVRAHRKNVTSNNQIHAISKTVPQSVPENVMISAKCWSEWQDLNLRPPRPERGARAQAARSALVLGDHDALTLQ